MKHLMLIDGYNLLHEVTPLGDLQGNGWEDARDQLIAVIADYQGGRQEKIYLVFDGHYLPANLGNQENYGRLSVIFTKEGESADTWIERKSVQVGRESRITVVTSDRLEQSFVWGQGALRQSARELWLEIEGNLQARKKNRKKEDKKFTSLEERLDGKTREIMEKWRRSG